MRVFLLRAILGLAMLPVACRAQFGFAEFRTVALRQIQQPDAPSRPQGSYLGVRLSEIDADRARILKLSDSRGVEVRGVVEGSPADNAGIQAGDILLSYNGEGILGAQQVIRLVQETPSGRKIKVQFWREGKERSTVLTTGAPPPADIPGPFVGLPFPDGRVYSPTATVSPRAILVWRDVILGIEFEELDSQLSEYFGVPGGVLIRWVEKGSPAEKSGLKTGDVIVSVRHKPVMSARDFTSCLRQPGAPASLTLVRNRKKLDVILTSPASEQ